MTEDVLVIKLENLCQRYLLTKDLFIINSESKKQRYLSICCTFFKNRKEETCNLCWRDKLK